MCGVCREGSTATAHYHRPVKTLSPAKNEHSVQPQQTDDGAAQPDVVYAHVIPVDTPAPAEAASLNHLIYSNLQPTSDYNNQFNDLYANVRP